MATQRDRNEFIHLFMKYAPLSLEEKYGSLRNAALKLLRYAATHRRIEAELTNGYKDRDGNWDKVRTDRAIAKRNRIDAKMEAIAPIEYGALAVAIRLGDRLIMEQVEVTTAISWRQALKAIQQLIAKNDGKSFCKYDVSLLRESADLIERKWHHEK